MRTISVLALVAWAVAIPGALRAADLTFALQGSAEYDSNVFRSSRDEESDVLFRIRPWVQLGESRGQDLSYSLFYAVPAEFAIDHSEVDDVDQQLGGDVRYHVNDRLEVFASDQFRYLRSELQTNFEGTDDVSTTGLINEQRDRVTMNDARVGSSYQFTPRLQGNVELDHSYFDPTRDDRAQNWQLQGFADLSYLLTPKHHVGGGVMVAHQEFDETQDIVSSTADIYNVFGSWRYAIDEKSDFSVRAGPSLIRAQQDDPHAVEMQGLVPFREVSGSFTAPAGMVLRDGTVLTQPATFQNGVMLVGQLSRCARIQDGTPGGTPVLTSGQSCPLNIVLDNTVGQDDDLINAIRNATATLLNADPQGDDSTDVTVFAEAVLTRHWTPNLHSALRYAREQGTASGLGGTVVGDFLTLSNTWNMTDKWQFALRSEWSMRNSLSDATRIVTVAEVPSSPLGGLGGPAFTADIAGVADGLGGTGILLTQRDESTSIDTMRWGVAARATRFFTRNTSGYLQFTYNQQQSQSDSLGDPSDFDDYLATIGIQHVFAPIKLW